MLWDIFKVVFVGIFRVIFNTLTKEEKEILKYCSERGEILWMQGDTIHGGFVRSGKHDFYKPEDREYAARYKSALKKLCNRGLVERNRGDLYQLTGRGFKSARSRSPLDVKKK